VRDDADVHHEECEGEEEYDDDFPGYIDDDDNDDNAEVAEMAEMAEREKDPGEGVEDGEQLQLTTFDAAIAGGALMSAMLDSEEESGDPFAAANAGDAIVGGAPMSAMLDGSASEEENRIKRGPLALHPLTACSLKLRVGF
jgi:hypothetical protein